MEYEKVNAVARSLCGMPKAKTYCVVLERLKPSDCKFYTAINLKAVKAVDAVALAIEEVMKADKVLKTKAEDYALAVVLEGKCSAVLFGWQ